MADTGGFTPISPNPDDTGGFKPITPASLPPAAPSLAERADDVLSYHPVYSLAKHAGPPIINALVADPIRSLAADVIGVVRSPPISDEARDKFWQERERSLDESSALRLPQTETGDRVVASVLGAPGQAVGALAGAVGDVTGTRDTLGPAATIAGDVLPFAVGGLASAMRRGAPTPGAVRAAKVENKARREISDQYAGSTYGGGPNALDIIDEMNKGRAAGQPGTLSDINNPALQRLTGSVYRGGGQAAARIKDFYEGRAGEANQRVGQAINTLFSDESLRDAMALQASERSAKGRPLWDKAMDHGSTAPFEELFTKEWNNAGRLEYEAAQRVAKAEAAMTQAAGRQAGAGNVYATSGANTAARDAKAALDGARQDLTLAQQQKAQMQAVMQKAQADGTANAPGATWSPGLQRLLDSYPEIRGLIAHGINVERRFAANDILSGKPFHPSDYAIVGTDAAGEAIIGTVPTMRAWHAAKVGIDDKIPGMKDQFGKLTANGASYLTLKNALLGELDRLNPAYKPARDMWGGDTAIMRAMQEGQETFSQRRFATADDLREHVAGLSESEKQAFVTAMAQDMRTRLSKISDPRDKSQMVNTPFTRERVRAVLGDTERADRFLDIMDREHRMKQTGNAVMGGSQTMERAGADAKRAVATTANVGELAYSLAHGHLPTALRSLRALISSHTGAKPAVDAAIGRMMTDPNLQISGAPGPILPPGAVPRRHIGPAQAIIGSEAVHPDDGVARAFGP